MPRNRIQWLAKWTERAKQLQQHDAEIKSTLPSHAAKILEPKRLALFKEILVDLEYPDIGAFDELVNGTDLVGEVKPFGIFEKAFRPAEKTVSQLKEASKSERMLNFSNALLQVTRKLMPWFTARPWKRWTAVGP